MSQLSDKCSRAQKLMKQNKTIFAMKAKKFKNQSELNTNIQNAFFSTSIYNSVKELC